MRKSVRDLAAGLIFIAFGLAFAIAASRYQIGTAFRMGPGYFPIVLGGLLVLLGIMVAVEGVLAGEDTPIGAVPWKALVLILGSIIFFGVTVRGLGLVPSLFVTVLMAAFASRRTTALTALLIAIGLTIGCVLIFVEALGLSIALFGPWVGPWIGL
ncbi:MAG TPA: tripartite tricarboxylate transporter TctB family protein [Propylenella sp.]|nr:tripartite tricarboxylate transporter TctB family protein [Propylenella sp.]